MERYYIVSRSTGLVVNDSTIPVCCFNCINVYTHVYGVYTTILYMAIMFISINIVLFSSNEYSSVLNNSTIYNNTDTCYSYGVIEVISGQDYIYLYGGDNYGTVHLYANKLNYNQYSLTFSTSDNKVSNVLTYIENIYIPKHVMFKCTVINDTYFNFNGINNNTIITKWIIQPSQIARVAICVDGVLLLLHTIVVYLSNKNVALHILTKWFHNTEYNVVYRRPLMLLPVLPIVHAVSIPEGTVAINSDNECIICCTYEANCKLNDCGHVCICVKCYMIMQQYSNRCPICREQIISITVVPPTVTEVLPTVTEVPPTVTEV
jgi:hypothetical protein